MNKIINYTFVLIMSFLTSSQVFADFSGQSGILDIIAVGILVIFLFLAVIIGIIAKTKNYSIGKFFGILLGSFIVAILLAWLIILIII